MPIGAGSILKGNIEIEGELGGGAMGVVWRGRNQALDSPVAVKVLAARVADDPDARFRFAREARAIAKVDSPHVVRIFDYGVTDEDEPFFVMELLRGEDLRAYLETRGTLTVETTSAIVRQLCTALSRAHELGIVHRDLKPANVFVLRQAGPPFVKVLDFGVAKLADPRELGLTASSALVGTPYYMSPEQIIEPSKVDGRADLWSVAVIAYACVVGKLPFQGETVGALSLAVHRGVFPAPSEARPGLPSKLDAWFLRAFDTDPERRFGSAEELSASFERVARVTAGGASARLDDDTLDGPAPEAPPPSAVQSAKNPASSPASRASKLPAEIDESMGGVGATVRATRPFRATTVVVGVAGVLAALVAYRVVSTPKGTTIDPPATALAASEAPTAPRPHESLTLEIEREGPAPIATASQSASAPTATASAASAPTSKPRATNAPPKTATAVTTGSPPPPSPPPPARDIDGVPIVR